MTMESREFTTRKICDITIPRQLDLRVLTDTEGGKMAKCTKPTHFGACRKCNACIESRQRQWLLRMILEAMLYENNAVTFLTLTYRPENLPQNIPLAKRSLQLFFKRLRKTFAESQILFRYVAALESGSNATQRYHWHAILYRIPFTTINRHIIDKAWDNGFIDWKPATPGRMHYVLKYVIKKDSAFLMSRMPGIGSGMLEALQATLNKLTEVERAKLQGNYMTMMAPNTRSGFTRLRVGGYDYPIHQFLKDRLLVPPISKPYAAMLSINHNLMLGDYSEKIEKSFKELSEHNRKNRTPKQLQLNNEYTKRSNTTSKKYTK